MVVDGFPQQTIDISSIPFWFYCLHHVCKRHWCECVHAPQRSVVTVTITAQSLVFSVSASRLLPASFSEALSLCRSFLIDAVRAQSYPTLCDPMDCTLPGSSVRGILQARILQWAAMPSSRGSSPSRDQTHVSCGPCTGRQILYHCVTWETIIPEGLTNIIPEPLWSRNPFWESTKCHGFPGWQMHKCKCTQAWPTL